MQRTILLVLFAALASPTPAEASHCQKHSQAFQTIKSLDAQAKRAEDRSDMAKACGIRKKQVKFKEQILRGVKTECFHGGKPAFAFSLYASKTLKEIVCNWDAEPDEDDFF